MRSRDELTLLRHGLQGSGRLVTLTGPGGIGKTWLARRAAQDNARAFTDGTYVVELDGLVESRLLVHTVAAGMGLQPHARHVDGSVLVPTLGDRHMLLVLDRCDHLVQECAHLVAELLRGCPRLRILATSRQTLGITGERVVTVAPLSVPSDLSNVDPSAALAHDAVALFVERATGVLPGFELTEENVAAVCGICVRLDGNPLAIELAAARAGLLAPQAILERLDDRYRLLTKGGGDTSLRLPSLRASVQASWDLCSEAERILWARLAVFPGDFEIDAVEEVCSGEGIEEVQVLDLVESLLEKSILSREAQPGAVRYRMLETLRAFGAERLGQRDARRWSDRHLRWTERLVLTAGREWFGPRQTSQLRRLRREHANVVAALDKATDDPAWASRAVRMIQALEPFWVADGRIAEARHWLAAALEHATDDPEGHAHALSQAAWFATLQGDLDEAEEVLTDASLVGRTSEPATLHALARARGCLSIARGDAEAAVSALTESVEFATRARSQAAVAEGWLLLGLTFLLAGRGDDAGKALRRCLTLAERAGDLQVSASALALQGLDALRREEVSSASTLARKALSRKAEVGDTFAVAFLLELLAWVAVADDDPRRTAILLGAAGSVWRTVGLTPAVMSPLAAGRDERLATAREVLGKRDFDRYVNRGTTLSSEAATRYALEGVLPRQREPMTSSPLTAREMGVAELVASGMSNREIAAVLVISSRTVQGHVEHILRKLGFGSRTQIAAWVARRGSETSV